MNNGKFSANEEVILDISRGEGKSKGVAARTIQQVDRAVCDASIRRNVFRPDCHRYSVFPVVCKQQRASTRGRALGYADVRIRGHVGVLIVRIDYPVALAVGVEDLIDLRVIQEQRRRESVLRVRARIPTPDKSQRIRGIEGVRQGANQPCVSIGVKTVVPAECGG